MLRVAHVIGPTGAGGAQTQLLGLVRAAHERLWHATVISTAPGVLSAAFAELDAPFLQLRRRGSPGLLRMRALRALVDGDRFDVLHGNLWQSNVYCRVAAAGRRRRPAVVISERSVEVQRLAPKRWLDAALAPVTDAYVGNTRAVGDFIRRMHPVTDQPVETIPNAVDRAVFHPAPTRRSNDRIVIGAAGRLAPEKGFGVLIGAVGLLSDRGVPVELRIAGDGALRTELEERAGALPVEFVGSLRPGRPMAGFLQQLHVFCLPSVFREGRPNVVLEALASGLPVVATDIPGLDEVLEPEALVPAGDAASLADALLRAAGDPEGWIAASRPARIPDFDELADRYRDVFDRAVLRSGR